MKNKNYSEKDKMGRITCKYCSNKSGLFPQEMIDDNIMEFICSECVSKEKTEE